MATEKQMIDPNEFLNRLENTVYDTPTDFGYTPDLIKTVLAQTKTVDAVEVVRCEKCLYSSQYPNENGMYKCGGILTEDGDCFLMVKPDHFCAFGKHRGRVDTDGP